MMSRLMKMMEMMKIMKAKSKLSYQATSNDLSHLCPASSNLSHPRLAPINIFLASQLGLASSRRQTLQTKLLHSHRERCLYGSPGTYLTLVAQLLVFIWWTFGERTFHMRFVVNGHKSHHSIFEGVWVTEFYEGIPICILAFDGRGFLLKHFQFSVRWILMEALPISHLPRCCGAEMDMGIHDEQSFPYHYDFTNGYTLSCRRSSLM